MEQKRKVIRIITVNPTRGLEDQLNNNEAMVWEMFGTTLGSGVPVLQSLNILGDRVSINTFGDNCYSNKFGNNCESNSFGEYFGFDFDNGYISGNNIGDEFIYNFIGEYYEHFAN